MAKIILITGGSASGKSTLAKHLKDIYGSNALILSQDNFYKPTRNNNSNFDIPDAFDWDAQFKALRDLKNNKTTKIPTYDFKSHDAIASKIIKPKSIILFEGLFTFDPRLEEFADFKIFVDTPSDTRLARRIQRDVVERGRKLENVIARWHNDVQPSYITYISEKRRYADIIVPWISVNNKAIQALLATLKDIE